MGKRAGNRRPTDKQRRAKSRSPIMQPLHILGHGISHDSGYGHRSLRLLEAQRKLGWRPALLTHPRPGDEHESGPGNHDRLHGMPCYYHPPPGKSRSPRRDTDPDRVRALVRRITEAAEDLNPDLLHAHSPVINGLAAIAASAALRIPVVYEIRALWEESAVAQGTYATGSDRYRDIRRAETGVCRDADAIVVISTGLKREFIERGLPPDKVRVVGNGVDADVFQPSAPDLDYKNEWGLGERFVFGYVGSFSRYEGLDLLLDAFATFLVDHPDSTLVLVGDGRAAADLKEHVQNLGIASHVVMPGRVPPERMPGIYGLIDVLVYPRRSFPLTEKVTPLKPLEAMAMAKPVIASDVGGHLDLLPDDETRLLFRSDDKTSLVEAMRRLFGSSTLRQRLASAARAWASRERSWLTMARLYDPVYQAVTSRRS